MAEVFKVQSFELFDLYNAAGETALSSSEIASMKAYMRDHKALGANTVALGWGVPVSQATGALESKFSIDSVHQASWDELTELAQYAKSIGLAVILKPQAQTSAGSASNNGLPDNINSFSEQNFPKFSSATFLSGWADFIGQAASFAQKIGAAALIVGSENQGFDTAAYRSPWEAIINAARAQYKGTISYDALYPIGKNVGVDKVSFWDLVDVIGVSAYYPMTSKANPTYADVLAGWTANSIYPGDTLTKVNVVAALHSLSVQYGKPVEFSEFGVQSFHGVVADPSGSGLAQKTPDWEQQAWMFQSLFEAFSANNADNWFLGVNSWGQSLVPGQDSNAFAGYLASLGGQTNFDIRGKDAGKVVAAWFGATNYMALTDAAFTGSMANDRIALFGTKADALAQVSRTATFPVTVNLTISGNIIGGKTPTLHFYLNGADLGTQTLDKTPSTYVDAAGVTWTPQQAFSFTLPAAADVSQLKIAMDSPANLGGPENSSFFVASASIGGVNLQDSTYFPLSGSSQEVKIGTGGGWNGGYQLLSAAPWNSSLKNYTLGSAANPLKIEGGAGTDTVYALGKPDQYKVSAAGANSYALSESAGLGQNAVLANVELLTLSDNATLNLAADRWSVQDTAAGLSRNIDDFRTIANAGKLSAVTLSDGGAPVIRLTASQLSQDAAVLAAVAGKFGLSVTVDGKNQTIAPSVGLHDTAVFSGARSSYQITKISSGYDVKDNTGASGTTKLAHVDRVAFSNANVALDVDGVAGQAYRIYQAAFNRAPDDAGLGYWISVMDHGASLGDTAVGFVGSAEFKALYGANPTNAEIINKFYNNVLHRAPDTAGFNYWVGVLDSHASTVANVLVGFSESAENQAALIGVMGQGVTYTPFA